MWLDCTQDSMRNTMMQHAGCISIELECKSVMAQVHLNTREYVECHQHSVSMLNTFRISDHKSSIQHGYLMEC